jgi:hypothetical protein
MQNLDYEDILTKQTRPGKKIKINPKLVRNQNVSVEIGTVDNKNHPKTIYLNVSFWVDIKDRSKEMDDPNFDRNVSKDFTRLLKNIYRNDLFECLNNNELFPYYFENIFSFDFPENLNYNEKKSFVNIEIHLHTVNNKINSKNICDYKPLRNETKNPFFSELVKIANIVADSSLLSGNENFIIYKKK